MSSADTTERASGSGRLWDRDESGKLLDPLLWEVDRHWLAGVFQVDVRTISMLAEEGMPRTTRGRYPLAHCIQWYKARIWRRRGR